MALTAEQQAIVDQIEQEIAQGARFTPEQEAIVSQIESQLQQEKQTLPAQPDMSSGQLQYPEIPDFTNEPTMYTQDLGLLVQDELPETRQYIMSAPGIKNARSVLAGFLATVNPEARIDILRENIPNINIVKNKETGEVYADIPIATGGEVRTVINRKGISGEDLRDFIGTALQYMPAGKVANLGNTLMKKITFGSLASGVTEVARGAAAGQSGSKQGYGGIAPEEVAFSTATGGLAETLPYVKSAWPKVKMFFKSADDPLATMAQNADDQLKSVDPNFVQEVQNQIAKASMRGKGKDLIVAADIDKSIIDDAADLGVDLNPDHYASNRQFIEIIQGLKSRAGSILSEREARAIEKLGSQADDLIKRAGGEIDKAGVSIEFRQAMKNQVDQMAAEADEIYKTASAMIPGETKLAPDKLAVINFIKEKAKPMRSGVSDLPGPMRRVYKQLSIKDGQRPTYANLNAVRQEIGSGLKRQGPFKDADQGLLKALYARLSQDQQRISQVLNPEAAAYLKTANDLVASRKSLEQNLADLMGNNLQKDLIPEVGGAMRALSRGKIEQFQRTVKSIPEDYRQRAVATALNDMFLGSSRKKGESLGQGFVDFYKGLNKNPTAKAALFEELPPIARQRADKIFNVAQGIYRAKALENTSKTARDIISHMDKNLGPINKLYTAVRVTGGKIPGVGMFADVLPDPTPAAVKADRFLSSDRFLNAMKDAAKGNIEKANKTVKSKVYSDFIKAANEGVKQDIARKGFFQWLLEEEENNGE